MKPNLDKFLTEDEVREMLREHIRFLYGTQFEASLQWGLTPSFISNVITGHKAPSQSILERLGLEKVFYYRKKEHGDELLSI